MREAIELLSKIDNLLETITVMLFVFGIACTVALFTIVDIVSKIKKNA